MAIVYRHIRKDTGAVFYIGIGSQRKRAFRKDGRTAFWNNIVNKAGGRIVEILAEGISIEDARELEELLIESYGRRINNTGILVNITCGGELPKGYSWNTGKKTPEEVKLKISAALTGRVLSKEHTNNMSIARKGQVPWSKGKKLTEAHIMKRQASRYKDKI